MCLRASPARSATVSEEGPPVPEAGAELSATLIRRYQRTGRITDIDAAIAALRRTAAPARPATSYTERAVASPAETTTALELATALRMRYLALADPEDLDEAIDVLRQAVRDAGSGARDVPGTGGARDRAWPATRPHRVACRYRGGRGSGLDGGGTHTRKQ